MALPSNADRVVVRGRWLDEITGVGVVNATVAFEPVPLGGASGTPNLRDLTAFAHIKTRPVTAAVDPISGYYAAMVLSTNDPDLDAYGGRRVTFTGETAYTIAVPHDAPLVPVDEEMAAAIPGLTVGQQVRAIWLVDATVVGGSPPPPVTSYLTAQQTTSAIAGGLDAHDTDPAAHPDIRALAAGGDASTRLLVTRTAAVALSGQRVVTPAPSGALVYADNQTIAHAGAPLWVTPGASVAGAAAVAVTAGPVTESTWAWTAGAPVFLAANGQLTQTRPVAPAVFVAQVGHASSPTTLHVDRAPSVQLA